MNPLLNSFDRALPHAPDLGLHRQSAAPPAPAAVPAITVQPAVPQVVIEQPARKPWMMIPERDGHGAIIRVLITPIEFDAEE